MSGKIRFRLALNFAMVVLMLAAFAYQLMGSLAHEITGGVLFVLFGIHNAVNRGWYSLIPKGAYSTRRIFFTVVNMLLLCTIILLAVSGVAISRDSYLFLGINVGYALRQLHTATAHWGLVLGSVHLGLHWNVIVKRSRKIFNTRWFIPLRIIAALIMFYGLYAFGVLDIGSKLFGGDTFSYWDFEDSAMGFFAAYIGIMVLCVGLAHYALKGLDILTGGKPEDG